MFVNDTGAKECRSQKPKFVRDVGSSFVRVSTVVRLDDVIVERRDVAACQLALHASLRRIAQSWASGVAVAGGRTFGTGAAVSALVAAARKSVDADAATDGDGGDAGSRGCRVAILTPMAGPPSVAAPSGSLCATFTGVLDVTAIVHRRATVTDALRALASDLSDCCRWLRLSLHTESECCGKGGICLDLDAPGRVLVAADAAGDVPVPLAVLPTVVAVDLSTPRAAAGAASGVAFPSEVDAPSEGVADGDDVDWDIQVEGEGAVGGDGSVADAAVDADDDDSDGSTDGAVKPPSASPRSATAAAAPRHSPGDAGDTAGVGIRNRAGTMPRCMRSWGVSPARSPASLALGPGCVSRCLVTLVLVIALVRVRV